MRSTITSNGSSKLLVHGKHMKSFLTDANVAMIAVILRAGLLARMLGLSPKKCFDFVRLCKRLQRLYLTH